MPIGPHNIRPTVTKGAMKPPEAASTMRKVKKVTRQAYIKGNEPCMGTKFPVLASYSSSRSDIAFTGS